MKSHFKDQIDKLTAIINSAIGREKTDFTQSDSYGSHSEKNSGQDVKYERLSEMILKMQDGQLEQRYVSRLGKWLLCDEQALRYYVEFCNLSTMLYMTFSEKQKNMTDEIFLIRH